MIKFLDLTLEEYLREFNLSIKDLDLILQNINHRRTIYDVEESYPNEYKYIAFKKVRNSYDMMWHVIDLPNIKQLTKIIKLKAFV
jgi:hypothetical protein